MIWAGVKEAMGKVRQFKWLWHHYWFFKWKILDYTTRNRKCTLCDLGHNKHDHDCRRNFEGSAKAMEADAGDALMTNSTILKEVGLNVRVMIGDEDSFTIAPVRKSNPHTI